MIPTARGTVVLCDANVLYKSVLRDLIVRLGVAGIIKPRWTEEIHGEWMGNLLAHGPDLKRERLERTRDLMNRAVPEALVEGVPAHSFPLPDPDDGHVLGAALRAGAQVLLYLQSGALSPGGVARPLASRSPDAFLRALLEAQEKAVLGALRELRAAMHNPLFSPENLLAAVARAELPSFAGKLGRFGEW